LKRIREIANVIVSGMYAAGLTGVYLSRYGLIFSFLTTFLNVFLQLLHL